MVIESDERTVMDLTPYLEGREYNRNVFIKETRYYLQMTLEGMINAGKLLICIKENEKHGRFGEALKEIGIDPNRARELMAIAHFLTEKILPKSPPGGDLKRFEIMGKKRLLLLSKLPDDVLDKFAETEEIGGLKLDEIESMPREELRKRCREMKKQIENGQKQIRRLRDKNDRLVKEQDGLDLASVDGVKRWCEKVFGKLNELHNLMNDGNAPKAEVFEGENGPACQSQLSPIDVMLLKINRNYEELKGNWGVE